MPADKANLGESPHSSSWLALAAAMSGRGFSGSHSLPPNPTYIDFPISDGDKKQWPTNTVRVVDSEGHVNYMRPVPLDESLVIKWRCEVGASLAVQLKKPGDHVRNHVNME
ncbi:hypothetical protein ID866_3253 [Astraeus odoratus]|nr:hypothetical protein ID866_3253 [Astraeus odoratus]